ncbi:SCO-spondin-like isoform X2 [Gigantopelta aegis]|uniref:SCO-spondin-like isoform X2 n=1 Tax=Gigantopelta aegis TaxID=1735272 RepID=UPI001B88A4CB|nr:SCO-spondin-like isoform X2 [Gigantopelta aegis]
MGWTSTVCLALLAFVAATQWAHVQAQVCPFDVLFVVDESEIMRSSQFTKQGKIAFKRVNDQIVSFLASLSQVKSPSVARAGYIAIGMDQGSRKAAREIIALNADLNAVTAAINAVTHQDIALIWSQILNSLPGLISAESKVIIITATQVSASERASTAATMSAINAEFFAIGLPFKRAPNSMTVAGLEPLASNASNIAVLQGFDDTSIITQLDSFLPKTCPKGFTAVCSNIMDVVVVVDGSFSISLDVFNKTLKTTLIGLTDNLFSMGRDMKIGLVLYSLEVDARIALTDSIANIKSSIISLVYPNSATWTHLGIKAAREMLINTGRKNSTKLMIIITDGESKFPTQTKSEATIAKNQDITIYAVGVGVGTQSELVSVASTPAHVLQAANYEELAKQLEALTAKCAVDGAWSAWTFQRLDPCGVTCGVGTQRRYQIRRCDNPVPKNDGLDCVGSDNRDFTERCDTRISCAAWGSWTSYTESIPCSITCGLNGVKTMRRSRTCFNDNAARDACGAQSPQFETRTELCSRPSCPSWGSWTPYNYGSCSATCGTGITQNGTRSRTCVNDIPSNLGCGALSPQQQQTMRPCSKPLCPSWGLWSGFQYGQCTKTCGTGATQTGIRTRTCLNDVPSRRGCGELSPQSSQQRRDCSLNPCPQWGPWSGYTAYTACSVTCGSNGIWRTRSTRICNNDIQGGGGCGAPSPQELTRTEACSTSRTCPFWGAWSGFTFTQCSATCGSGFTRSGTRTRICLNNIDSGLGCGGPSPDTDRQTQDCVLPACPFWSDWTPYKAISACSVTCGSNGVWRIQRTRTCNNDVASRMGCGKFSPDTDTKTETCSANRQCPSWTDWSPYSYTACSATCGVGISRTGTRTRTCMNDIPSGFGCGAKSPEEQKQIEACSVPLCPRWSAWTQYTPTGPCSVTCGPGGIWRVQRTRTCINDNNAGNACGAQSPQPDGKTESCSSGRTCPFWSAWSGYTYGDCSATCGIGITRMGTRSRVCYNDISTKNGCGATSPQQDVRPKSCLVPLCPSWGSWSNFTEASACSVTCGSGGVWTLQRRRICNNDIAAGTGCGSKSPAVERKTESCSTFTPCPMWAAWTPYTYGACSATCGTGVTRIGRRSRTCLNDNSFGIACGAKSPQEQKDIQQCQDRPCPLWSVWTDYIPVGSCSETCGPYGVWRTERTRTCLNDIAGGNGCGAKSPQMGSMLQSCPAVPVPCPAWTTWSTPSYTACSVTCGTGSRTGTRGRRCLNDDASGRLCGADSPQTKQQTEACNEPACPLWSGWTQFRSVGPCSVTCGPGGVWTTQRSRVCRNDNANNNGCGASSPQSDSITQSCVSSVTCPYWGAWSGYTYDQCSATCGTGVTRMGRRIRICRNDNQQGNGCGAASPQPDVQPQTCQVPLCPSWGLWTPFTQASACSVTCGGGGTWMLQRRRICENDTAAGTGCGSKSPDIDSKTEFCSIATPCPRWTGWTPYTYGACSATCGVGITRSGTRTRTCSNDIASGFGCGAKSPEVQKDIQNCEDQLCPFWGQWSPFVASPCSVTCGTGGTWTKQRTRQCVNDISSGDGCGATSPQADSKTESCSSPVTCPYWATWSGYAYTACSATCGTGVTRMGTRSRICINDNASHTGCNGISSPQSDTAPKPCKVPLCPFWGDWSVQKAITECSVTCGTGGSIVMQRRRVCNNDIVTGKGCGSQSPQDETTTVACSNRPPCPAWETWSGYSISDCSATCGAGATRTRVRSRNCQNDIPSKLGCGAKSPEEQKAIEECNLPMCSFWSAWTQYTPTEACSVTCGPGGVWRVQRTRTCINDNQQGTGCGAQSPQSDLKTQSCSSGRTCPFWGSWSGFTYEACSATCGSGITRIGSRTRICRNDVQSGDGCGAQSPQVDRQPQACTLPSCPFWSDWSVYTPTEPCSATCGTNGEWTTRRERTCTNDGPARTRCGALSPQWETRKEACSTGVQCPYWSEWTPYIPQTACSKTCGRTSGFQTVRRTRSCINDLASGGGCGIGSTEQTVTQACFVNIGCPVDGQWGQWKKSPPGACSVTCGKGIMTTQLNRACDSPVPQNNGRDCAVVNGIGPTTFVTESCTKGPCPRQLGLCDGATIFNGVGYRLHPTDCHKYVLCYYRNNGYTIGVIKTCPFDKYWNQKVRKCEPSCDVDCPIEKCKDTDISTYNYEGSWKVKTLNFFVAEKCKDTGISTYNYEGSWKVKTLNFFCCRKMQRH